MRAFSSLRAVLQNCTMRVLIVAVAVFACAAASPSGLLAAPFAHGYAAPLAVSHAAPLAYAHAPVAVAHAAPALPTISPGDVNGAIIDAHVNAADHTRAAVDAVRQVQDKHAEINGQAVNAAVDHSWRALDAVKTQEAQLDGAAAGVAPVLAKQIAGQAAYAAPVAYAAHAAPVAYGYAAPTLGYAAPALGYAAPSLGHATPALSHGYAAPTLAHGYAAPALGYAAAPIAHYSQAPVAYAHGW